MTTLAAMSLSTSCQAQENLTLCPSLSDVGKGNRLYEEALRCVRVMAARYSISGESPADIATAAIDFCRDWKIAPIFSDQTDLLVKEKLQLKIEDALRGAAIRTVVEMRTAKCHLKPGLFDGINDPISRP